MPKNKSVYISIGNEDTPNKIVIGGKEIDATGVTYFALELTPLKKPRYVIAYHGMEIETHVPFKETQVDSDDTDD